MDEPQDRSRIVVRESEPADQGLAEAAAALIEQAAEGFDIARRSPEWLAAKIRAGRAALALQVPPGLSQAESDGAEPELVGFGYWSEWESGRFVSHSGLVVRPDRLGIGLGRQLKQVLFESSRRQLPGASLMSLTTSEQVRRMNLSLGFRSVPLDQLTKDEAFWEGCRTCRNYAEVQTRTERCCCQGLLFTPGDGGGA